MKRYVFTVVLLAVLSSPSLSGSQEFDHGPTGTLNHDYFNPDATIQRLRANVDVNHTKPLFENIALRKMSNAIEEINYILARFPNHVQALSMTTAVAKLTKNSAFGIPFYERATSMFPRYAITHAQYGKYLVDFDQTTVGIERLKKAVELDPKLAPAYAWLAGAYLKSGNVELARESAAKAREFGFQGKLPDEISPR
jgi:predicted Zn-dependent protease